MGFRSRARPGDTKPFYGWVVVGATAFIALMGCAFGGMNAGVFIRPMGDDIGISRTMFGWAVAARQIGGALVTPINGRIVDRRGGRPSLVVGGVLAAVGLVWLSRAEQDWEVIGAFLVLGATGMIGAGAVSVTTPATKWFVRDRARAVAWLSLGIPIGTVIFVPLSQALIAAYGWRQAWLILAVVALVTVVPASLLVRREPEDYGLFPDGSDHPPEHARAGGSVEHPGWETADAFRTATFYRLVVVFSLVQLTLASVGLHRLPHWVDQGIDPGLVSWASSLDAACAAVGTVIVGRLARRAPAKVLGAAGFTGIALAVGLTIVSHGALMMFVSMAAFGTAIGCMLMIQNLIWVDYFGRKNVGRIRGRAVPVTLLCSAAGPVIAGAVFDATGSYNPVWVVGIGLMLFGAAVLLTTKLPAPPVELSHRAAVADVVPGVGALGD